LPSWAGIGTPLTTAALNFSRVASKEAGAWRPSSIDERRRRREEEGEEEVEEGDDEEEEEEGD
jgi:hypothetical protein